jgi:hypothetical protein
MRRISRLDRSIESLIKQTTANTSSYYLCSVCKHQTTSFSTSPLRTAKVPFTESLRKKIWGTDKPPGLEDPYGGKSVFGQSGKGSQRSDIEKGEQWMVSEEAERRAEEAEILREEEERLEREFLAQPRAAASPEALQTEYVPANDWAGLETVGLDFKWQPREQFEGFQPAKRMENGDEITMALHRAVVEVFALQQAGIPLDQVSNLDTEADLNADVHIIPSAGGASLQFSKDNSYEKFMLSLSPAPAAASDIPETDDNKGREGTRVAGVQAGEESHQAHEVDSMSKIESRIPYEQKLAAMAETVATWDPSWLQISLINPEIKFAVSSTLFLVNFYSQRPQILKRTMQLTGIRIPDSMINSALTVDDIRLHIISRPKPKTLFDTLHQKYQLTPLPNVKIHQKRVTFVQREKSIGRLKLIEKELVERGLPTWT